MTQEATILYIEDDDASRALVRRVLIHAGYRVLVASRALEGIDLARVHHPDLILTDINLPDLSGREIAVRLRADPGLAGVPIVALTAQVHASERKKTFAAGVVGYITKPIDTRDLVIRVREFLDGRRDTLPPETLHDASHEYERELVARLEATVRDLEASNRALRRLDRLKDDFIQLTAHELRTPLTTVYGYSQLVQTSKTLQQLMQRDEEAHACLSGLIDSIERLHRVVDEIITVSRIASGRVGLKLGPTNLTEIVEQVAKDYAQVIAQRNLVLVFAPDQWPGVFYADATLLELAISNLLGNAIKYTPDGGTITIGARTASNHTVHFSIQDTGIGIDPDEQHHVFEQFYTAGDTQLHSTSKTAFRGGGLGLGLAICRGIIEAHGGRIWVESEACDPERLPGSIFHVELPLRTHAPIANQDALIDTLT